jgi:monovalent cation:H+ antiporter-2, CPA2 family
VLFFVSVGMLFNPMVLVEQPLQVLAVVGIIVVGKSVAAAALVLAFRYPLNTALTVSASLAQIGEFSFILAGLGMSLGLLPAEGQSLILAGADLHRPQSAGVCDREAPSGLDTVPLVAGSDAGAARRPLG